MRELGEAGARFVSVTEGFDSVTPTGKMMVTMLSGLAEMESATKSERTQAWHGHRRANGSTPTGPRPYGYKRERNELHIVKAEATVIRKAASKIIGGASLRGVVADINATGRSTRTTSRSNAEGWRRPSSVRPSPLVVRSSPVCSSSPTNGSPFSTGIRGTRCGPS